MKKALLTLAATAVLFGSIVAPPAVSAIDINRYLCIGINMGDTTKCGLDAPADNSENEINQLSQEIVNILSLIVGIISVIMIIIGGLRYITSGGDSNSVTGAKNTILYAIVGLIIVIFAQVFVRFILGLFTKEATPTA
jgi:hypothetical protein